MITQSAASTRSDSMRNPATPAMRSRRVGEGRAAVEEEDMGET